MQRAAGRCESCNANRTLEWDHTCGRGHLVSEPWASSPFLTVGLCRSCHRMATDERLGVREFTRELAARRLTELAKSQAYPAVIPSDFHEYNPLQKIRYLVRYLEYPDGWENVPDAG